MFWKSINLWGGLAMLVFAALFVLWARLRPIVVPLEAQSSAEERPPGE